MKKTIFAFAMMLSVITCGAYSRDKNVPEPVVKSFSSQYPQIKAEKWKLENNSWVARYDVAKTKYDAYYSSDGDWLKTEAKIPWSKDLPVLVDNSFDQSNFKSWYIDYMKERQTPAEKNLYVIQVHRDCGPEGSVAGDCESIYRLYFDANGSFLREKQVR